MGDGQQSREDEESKAADCTNEAALAEQETKDSKPLVVNTAGVTMAGETPTLIGEFHGKGLQ